MMVVIYMRKLKPANLTSKKETRPLFLYPASLNNITPHCNPSLHSFLSFLSLSYLPGK